MESSSRYESLISGRTRGPVASLARGGLRIASFAYGRVMAVRNAYYDTWAFPVWLDVPVISVGNLTVGGTGKTPLTIWLCERMLERGLKPAVLSRGYKATQEAGADELLLISRRVPAAVAVAHPDRARAGLLAIEQYHVRAAILDDGFQHRRVGRDLDILLIDATRPFGYGFILPRGLLRERVSSLRRADAVILTRCDQAEPGALERIEAQVRVWNREVPILRATHEPTGFAALDGKPAERPAAGRIGCMTGIARPEAFVRTLTDLGLAPVATGFYPDHYAYSPADVQALSDWVRDERLDCLLTTEKDAVKLARIPAEWPVPVLSVGVRIRLLADGEKQLGELIDRMIEEHEQSTPTESADEQETRKE